MNIRIKGVKIIEGVDASDLSRKVNEFIENMSNNVILDVDYSVEVCEVMNRRSATYTAMITYGSI